MTCIKFGDNWMRGEQAKKHERGGVPMLGSYIYKQTVRYSTVTVLKVHDVIVISLYSVIYPECSRNLTMN